MSGTRGLYASCSRSVQLSLEDITQFQELARAGVTVTRPSHWRVATRRHRPAEVVSIAGKMATGLHLSIRRTGRTAVDHVAVIAEDAGELLCDVRSAVPTPRAGCRRFHRLPVVFHRGHGWGCARTSIGVHSPAASQTAKEPVRRGRALRPPLRMLLIRASSYRGQQMRIKDADCSPRGWR